MQIVKKNPQHRNSVLSDHIIHHKAMGLKSTNALFRVAQPSINNAVFPSLFSFEAPQH